MVSYIKHMSPKRVRKDGPKVSVLPTAGWSPPRDVNVDVFARGVWVRDVCESACSQSHGAHGTRVNSQIFSS